MCPCTGEDGKWTELCQRFGAGSKHGTEGDIAGAITCCRLGQADLIVTGYPDDGVIAQAQASGDQAAIALAEMDAIGTHRDSKIDIIIDEQGDVIAPA